VRTQIISRQSFRFACHAPRRFVRSSLQRISRTALLLSVVSLVNARSISNRAVVRTRNQFDRDKNFTFDRNVKQQQCYKNILNINLNTKYFNFYNLNIKHCNFCNLNLQFLSGCEHEIVCDINSFIDTYLILIVFIKYKFVQNNNMYFFIMFY